MTALSLEKVRKLRIARLCIIYLAIFIFVWTGDCFSKTAESQGQVWEVGTRRWDVADEHRFADWMEKTVTEDFFIKHRIPIDCADVPYALRWIYARIAHLPAAATTRDGRLFGNWSTTWKNLPSNSDWSRDRRFRAALLHMLEVTTTETMPADTYPIRISADTVLAGTVFLANGHAGIVGHIVRDGSMFSPIQTWEATLPRKIRKLRQKSYFFTWPDEDAGTGLVQFRWPVYSDGHWHYLPKREQPLYSEEQYNQGFYHKGELFDEAVARRIDPTKYDPVKKAGLIIGSIYRYLEERIPIVQAGYRRCRHAKCNEGSSLWEIYSTPGRDDMIAFEIEHLEKLIEDNGLDEKALQKTMEKMTLPIKKGWTVTLNYVVQNYRWMSHDPGDPIEARWGLNKCGMIRSQMQSTLQSMQFVEHTYRATDPDYADYSSRLRFTELKSLQKQGTDAGCTDLPPLPREGPWPPIAEQTQRTPAH